jgi:hypothetical protein
VTTEPHSAPQLSLSACLARNRTQRLVRTSSSSKVNRNALRQFVFTLSVAGCRERTSPRVAHGFAPRSRERFAFSRM